MFQIVCCWLQDFILFLIILLLLLLLYLIVICLLKSSLTAFEKTSLSERAVLIIKEFQCEKPNAKQLCFYQFLVFLLVYLRNKNEIYKILCCFYNYLLLTLFLKCKYLCRLYLRLSHKKNHFHHLHNLIPQKNCNYYQA